LQKGVKKILRGLRPFRSRFCCTNMLQQTVSCGIDGTQGLKASPIPEEDNSTLRNKNEKVGFPKITNSTV
jgi:hypothetical protein